METCYTYKGFSVRYTTFDGTTTVEDVFGVLAEWRGLGELAGRAKAEAFIERLRPPQ